MSVPIRLTIEEIAEGDTDSEKAHSESIEYLEECLKSKDYCCPTEHLVKVALVASFFDFHLVYKRTIKMIAQKANLEEISNWRSDMQYLSEYDCFEILDCLLMEQPKVELFELLVGGKNPTFSLIQRDMDAYAVKFAAHKASGKTLSNEQRLWRSKSGFCGNWQYCYLLERREFKTRYNLAMYNTEDQKRLWEVDEVAFASYQSFCSQATILRVRRNGRFEITDRKNSNLLTGKSFSFPMRDVRSSSTPAFAILTSCRSILIKNACSKTYDMWELDEDNFKFKKSSKPEEKNLVFPICLSPDDSFEIMHVPHSTTNNRRTEECMIRFRSGDERTIKLPSGIRSESGCVAPDSKSFVLLEPQIAHFGNLGENLDVQCTAHNVGLNDPELRGVDYSPDGRFIALVAYDRTILIFESNGGSPKLLLEDHTLKNDEKLEYIYGHSVEWSPEGELLLVGLKDCAVVVPIMRTIRRKEEETDV